MWQNFTHYSAAPFPVCVTQIRDDVVLVVVQVHGAVWDSYSAKGEGRFPKKKRKRKTLTYANFTGKWREQ